MAKDIIKRNILVIISGLLLMAISVTAIRYGINKLRKKYNRVSLHKTHEEKVFENYKNNLFGIDVSHYQGDIDWDAMKQSKGNKKSFNNNIDISFVIMRAAIGEDEEDRKFDENWLNAKKHGIIRGAYHYYRPDENSIKQANNFISIVKLEKGDLPAVLDIEAIPNVQSVSSLKKGLKKWLNKVEKHFGIKPIIYTADSYYTYHYRRKDLLQHGMTITERKS